MDNSDPTPNQKSIVAFENENGLSKIPALECREKIDLALEQLKKQLKIGVPKLMTPASESTANAHTGTSQGIQPKCSQKHLKLLPEEDDCFWKKYASKLDAKLKQMALNFENNEPKISIPASTIGLMRYSGSSKVTSNRGQELSSCPILKYASHEVSKRRSQHVIRILRASALAKQRSERRFINTAGVSASASKTEGIRLDEEDRELHSYRSTDFRPPSSNSQQRSVSHLSVRADTIIVKEDTLGTT